MSGFYYTRQYGPDGQILCAEGTPEGRSLRELVGRDRPPLRAALELGAALGDLLCIAAEDGAVHGGIDSDQVYVNDYGDVSIVGYGLARDGGRAPERRGDAPSTDLFGVGLVVFEAISSAPLGPLPTDADAHDDAVVDAVHNLDFSAVEGRKWLDEAQRFVARLLAWSPDDRPAALDAANVLGAVAQHTPTEDLPAWAKRAASARKAAPVAAAIPESVPLRAMPEILDQPLSLTAPFKPGGVRQAKSAKGESTSFWSRERIAEMFADEEEDDAPPPSRMSVEVEVSASALRPKLPPSPPRAEERLEPARPVTRPLVEPPAESLAPPRAIEPAEARREARREEPRREEARREEPRREARREEARPARPEPPRPDPFEAEPEKESKGGGGMVFAAGGLVVLLAVLCGGGLLAGGAWWYWSSQGQTAAGSEAATEVKTEAPAEAAGAGQPAAEGAGTEPAAEAPKTEEGTAKAEEAKAEPAKAETPAAAPTGTEPTKTESTKTEPTKTESTKTESTRTDTKKTESTRTDSKSSTKTSSTTTTPTTTTTTKSTSSKTTTATTPTASANFSVRFSIPGEEGKLYCGDGQTAKFTGSTMLSFTSTTSCRVEAGGKKTAVTVSRNGTVTCSSSSGTLTCSGGG